MSSSPMRLVEAATAVAALGRCRDEISLLDDSSLVAGMALLRELDAQAQAYKLWMSAEIGRRSDHTLGYDGLARRSGSATPAIFIQSMTGTSIEEATKLARLGQVIADSEVSGAPPTPVAAAAVSGGISVDAADAIRRGLGEPDAAVSASQLADVADELIARAGAMTPEALLKAARQARNNLDLDAIERSEKQRSMTRYVRTWSREGMSGGSWALPDEDGGLEILTALKLMVAKQTSGPRFADNTKGSPVTVDTPPVTANSVVEDVRQPEHVMADGFVQIFHNGLTADPTIVPGASRAPVRVIVPAEVLVDRIERGPDVAPTGSAVLEETMSAISFGKLGEYLCEGGTVGIAFDDKGQILDTGREQRLFTKTQRTALGVRDGGCRFPGCAKPPSWTEAHHIEYWARDRGKTDIANGMLLCRYHHMLIHQGWEISRDNAGDYWVKPPKERDPHQKLVRMPSNNPLLAAFARPRGSDQQVAVSRAS